MSSPELLSSNQIAQAILTTVQYCRAVVAGFANGSLSAPQHHVRTKDSDLRAAPGFARGSNLKARNIVLYTSRDVAEALSNICGVEGGFLQSGGKDVPRQSSRWIMVAMALLEFFEENPKAEAGTLEAIRDGRPGFTVNSLLKRLRAARKAVRKEAKQNAKSLLAAAGE